MQVSTILVAKSVVLADELLAGRHPILGADVSVQTLSAMDSVSHAFIAHFAKLRSSQGSCWHGPYPSATGLAVLYTWAAQCPPGSNHPLKGPP